MLVLGVAYKAGVGDMRESPALKIIRELRELGAEVAYHDPHVPELPELGLRLGGPRAELGRCRPRLIVTAHAEVDYERVVARGGAGARLARRHARDRGPEPRPALRLLQRRPGATIAAAPTG